MAEWMEDWKSRVDDATGNTHISVTRRADGKTYGLQAAVTREALLECPGIIRKIKEIMLKALDRAPEKFEGQEPAFIAISDEDFA